MAACAYSLCSNRPLDDFPACSSLKLRTGYLYRTHSRSIFGPGDLRPDAARFTDNVTTPGAFKAFHCLALIEFQTGTELDTGHLGKAAVYCDKVLDDQAFRGRVICAVTNLKLVQLVWREQ